MHHICLRQDQSLMVRCIHQRHLLLISCPTSAWIIRPSWFVQQSSHLLLPLCLHSTYSAAPQHFQRWLSWSSSFHRGEPFSKSAVAFGAAVSFWAFFPRVWRGCFFFNTNIKVFFLILLLLTHFIGLKYSTNKLGWQWPLTQWAHWASWKLLDWGLLWTH